MRQVIIFGKTQEVANDKLKQILNNTPYGEVKDIKLTRDKCSFTTNDSIYISLGASDCNRGYGCNYAYIDKDISIEMFNNTVDSALTNNPDGYEFY